MGELETSLAVLFKRKGKNVITDTEFIFTVSFDFRWFTPKEAQALLDVAIKRGLLTRTEEFLKPNFDYKDVEASALVPTEQGGPERRQGGDVPLRPAHPSISDKGGLKKRDAVARVNRTQERLGVDVEVAAVVVAKDLGIDVSAYLEPVKKEILGR